MAKPKFKHHLIYYCARVLMFFLGVLPYPLVSRLGRSFGALLFQVAGGEKRKTLRSIRTAYPKGLSDEEAERLALRVWVNLGRNLFELIHWMGWPRERILSQVARHRGLENIDKVLPRGKGFFVVTAHLGNWELLGGFLRSRYEGSALAQKMYDPRFDELMTRFREEKLGGSMIKRGLALRGILEALKKNHGILALCDQDTGQDGVFVPFYGKPAWTQSGVARIARRTGAALVPAFMLRGADGKFELHVEKEVPVPRTDDPESDILEAVRRYTEVIESYVKAYPDQWMWMHDRWKTRPPGEAQ